MSGSSTWSGKRVVVTGGAGFLGSHLVDALVSHGAWVRIIDNLSSGFLEFVNRSERVEFVRADLLNPLTLEPVCAGADLVFHMAANADVRDGLLHPCRDTEQNLVATQNLLEVMRRQGVKALAYASSGAVYGDAKVLPTPEDAPFPVQTSLYGASKVAAEGLLTAYAVGYAFRVWIFRFVSLLGPRYSHGHVFDFWRKLREDPRKLEVLGDGNQNKSYLHVSDCVEAVLLAVQRSGEPINLFNVGHTDCLQVKDSLRIICRELGLSPEVHYTGGERGWVGDAPRVLLDTARLRALGWSPQRGLEESVIETLRFLEQNPGFAGRR